MIDGLTVLNETREADASGVPPLGLVSNTTWDHYEYVAS